MQLAEPKVFLVAHTALNENGLSDYLAEIGNPDWGPSDNVTDAENLVEAAGRMCYRSWQPFDPKKPRCTNPNVNKVREGNDAYLSNILKSGHGSILEHANLTFIATDVSRVFTHELVRHRAGCAYSQESLRYVRLDELRFWIPRSLRGTKTARFMLGVVSGLEWAQKIVGKISGINKVTSFAKKKQMTSAFRRIAPIGLSTSIMFTVNVRAARHIIQMRTSVHAEEEVREVFQQVADICLREYPNFFGDMDWENGEYTFTNGKI